jgi:tetratricopeptide (TPR) repeat protein
MPSLRFVVTTAVAMLCLSTGALTRAAVASPQSEEAQSHITSGANAAAENDWQSALQEFLRAAAIDEHSEKALYHVGIAYYHLGRMDQARIAELLAIQANPQFLPPYIELATIETKRGKYPQAKLAITEALKLWPDNKDLASALLSIMKLEKKAALVPAPVAKPVHVSPMSKSALLFTAKDIAGLLRESELAFQQGDLPRAKHALRLAIKLAPDSPEPHWRLCQVLEAEGETIEAVAEAQKAVTLDDQNPQWYLALGWAYSRCGKWTGSFEAFKEAYKLDNNLHDAIVGECYALAKQKQTMLARITLHVSDPEAHDTSWYHAANGLILEEKGDLDGAYDELKRAVEIAPGDYQARYTLARISYQVACRDKKKDSWKKAAQHARDLLAITPSDIEVLINLGICLSSVGDNDGAIGTMAKACKISPANASAHAAYASVLAAAGQSDAAMAEAKIAKKLNPGQKLAETILKGHK